MLKCQNCGKEYPRDIYTYPGFCCVLCMTEFADRGGPQPEQKPSVVEKVKPTGPIPVETDKTPPPSPKAKPKKSRE